jgi:hypothetical protein
MLLTFLQGVWILKPGHENEEIPRIWIRKSQCKIQYSETDPLLQTFDLVAPNRVTYPARLGLDAINCLADGSITAQHLTPFIESLMNRYFMALTDWDGPNKTGCCERLALFLQNEGLATSIPQRLCGGSARAYGFGFRRQKEEQVDEDVDQIPADKWAPNPLSGYGPSPLWHSRKLNLLIGVQLVLMNLLSICFRQALIQTPIQYCGESLGATLKLL